MNGLRASVRIRDLADEMKLSIGKTVLIVNDAPEKISSQFMDEVEKTGLSVLGFVPEDATVPAYDIEKRPLVDLPDSAPAVAAVNAIADKLFVN